MTESACQAPSQTATLLAALSEAVRRGELPLDIEAQWRSQILAACTETRVRSKFKPAVDSSGTDLGWDTNAGLPPSDGEVSTGRLLGGRYLLERKLGEGGMGVVYLASDQQVKGESFAIKVLRPEVREYPESLALLHQEVRKTRSLAHPNIVGVYSMNSDNDCVYMLMEYLEGKTLDALLDEEFGRGMPFERAWPLIQEVGAALAYAHDRNVIHSDLKPSNIFVTTAGRAKLLDFGIARAARGRPRGFDPATLGALTPAYASCEMFEGKEPDPRDDIYALACVIYEMFSGKRPFGSCTAVEARAAKRQPAPIASLSRNQNAALAKALAFDREHRAASVEELLAGLARATGPSLQSLLLRVGALALILVVGGFGWFAWNSRHEVPRPTGTVTGPVNEAANGTLATVRGLVDQARATEVDGADPSLVDGLRRFHAAERQLAAGAEADGAHLLTEAETALRDALHGGARVAHIGSGADEVLLALKLCKQAGDPCSPSDFADEAPRTVVLRPFALDLSGVTNEEFTAFAQEHGYLTAAERGRGLYAVVGSKLVARPGQSWKTLRDQDSVAGTEQSGYPVRGIDFESAQAYCAALGKRLPTEEEWEYVARPDHRIFPWGDDPARTSATPPRLVPVSEQPATGRFGARGLGGMLWEWVDGGTASSRVLRGGSWQDPDPVHQRLAIRLLENPAWAHVDMGFRCARSVDFWPDEPRSVSLK